VDSGRRSHVCRDREFSRDRELCGSLSRSSRSSVRERLHGDRRSTRVRFRGRPDGALRLRPACSLQNLQRQRGTLCTVEASGRRALSSSGSPLHPRTQLAVLIGKDLPLSLFFLHSQLFLP